MNLIKINPKFKKIAYVVGCILVLYIPIGSTMIFEYGYKPDNYLKDYDGIVVDVHILTTSFSTRSGGFSGVVMDIKKNVKDREYKYFKILEFSSEKQDQMLKSIRIGSLVKVKYFKTGKVVYADFDNGYKISQHSKVAGKSVFYAFWIAIPLTVLCYYLTVYYKYYN